MPNMFTQMDAVCHRFEELSIRLNQPDTAADPALFRRLMQEYHDAEPVVQAYRAWQTAQDHLAQAKALLEEPGALDPDFKQMIQQEISEKSQDVEKLENNLKILLLPKDVNDGKNVIVEIRGGAGGEEAALFAHSLLRMYTMYVQSRGWQLEMLNLNETELGGVKEAIFSVDGAGAYNRLKYESGVHRVQPHPHLHGHGGCDAAGRRGGLCAGHEGPAHRHLPLLRRGRSAHQQNLQRHPCDTSPHRHGGRMPERAQPVPE